MEPKLVNESKATGVFNSVLFMLQGVVCVCARALVMGRTGLRPGRPSERNDGDKRSGFIQ